MIARTLVLLFVASPAWACKYPDEGGMPLRRAVTRVQQLPETRDFSFEMHQERVVVHYALLLEQTHREGGRCYWTVEVSAGGRLWRRFFVTPDGKSVLPDEGKRG